MLPDKIDECVHPGALARIAQMGEAGDEIVHNDAVMPAGDSMPAPDLPGKNVGIGKTVKRGIMKLVRCHDAAGTDG